MESMDEKRLILALAIQRIAFLRPEEKLVLWDLVDDELSLSLLLPSDVEAAIGRSLGSRVWTPEVYREEALGDARFLERSNCRFLHYDDATYPAALRETCRPPFGLYARGPGRLSEPAVAVVGTRMPTGRGVEAAFDLCASLAEAGISVVSGLARGIDAAAHRGALVGSARRPESSIANRAAGTCATCAVLPCGIDGVYPRANRGLAFDILEAGGILLSEYPPGTTITKFRFPERNRIIAGLCRACLVVEAPAKSGALITADHALDEGRDVWVASACLGGARSAGIDRLAADGAEALSDASALVDELRGRFGKSGAPASPAESGQRARMKTGAERRANSLERGA